MSRLYSYIALTAGTAATALALAAPAAYAGDPTVTFNVTVPNGAEVLTMTDAGEIAANPHAQPVLGYAGPYTATINGVQINTYCVDLYNSIVPSTNYTNYNDQSLLTAPASGVDMSGFYNPGGLASALTAPPAANGYYANLNASLVAGSGSSLDVTSAQLRADAVALIANADLYAPPVDTDQAAVSLAIWDIIQDGVVGDITDSANASYGVTSAEASTVNTDAATYETYYLGLVSANGYTLPAADKNVLWIQGQQGPDGNHTQDFLTLNTVPGTSTIVPVPTTPEPGIVVTSLSMMGTLGLGLVRGRRRTTSGRTIA